MVVVFDSVLAHYPLFIPLFLIDYVVVTLAYFKIIVKIIINNTPDFFI